MSGQTRKKLEDMLTGHPQRELLQAWCNGADIDETSADELLELVITLAHARGSRMSETEIRDILRSARLDWSQSFAETVFHRLADDPAEAIRHLKRKRADLGAQNAQNASKPRESRQDWWSQHISDCIEDNLAATVDEVIEYLVQTGEVSTDGETLSNTRNAADLITRTQVRSKMQAAKKRFVPES
jgi:hypothetical protein